jgi:hypothetical protein
VTRQHLLTLGVDATAPAAPATPSAPRQNPRCGPCGKPRRNPGKPVPSVGWIA